MSRFDNMQGDGLDAAGEGRDGRSVMTRTPMLIMLAAAAALAGCKKESHTIIAGPPNDYDTNVSKTPVPLPPSVTASKVYRCSDNSIVYVDWLSDNKSANVRTKPGGNPTQVTAPEPGKPMTAAGGYSIEGKSSDASVKIAVPGHPAQSCKG
jgi:hypothetical protein